MVPFRNRTIDPTQPVEVYRNIRRKDYSVRQKGYVVARADKIVLKEATFVVQEAGRLKVLETGCKNVHAWVRGYVNTKSFRPGKSFTSARYNPKKMKAFVDEHGKYVTEARFVILSDRGVLYV